MSTEHTPIVYDLIFCFFGFTDGEEIKILAVDPNTYKFLIKKCAEDAAAAGVKVTSDIKSEVKTEPVAEEDSKHEVKDEVLDGLGKADMKDLQEEEETKAGALTAQPDGVQSEAGVGNAKLKQEPSTKGGKESTYNLLKSVKFACSTHVFVVMWQHVRRACCLHLDYTSRT
jgi:hypothetical protein